MRYIRVAVPDDFDPEKTKLMMHRPEEVPESGYALDVWQPIYRDVLDKGFIGLVDFMGDDQAVVDAARVSYGAGTRRVSEDRGLIRYLFRHSHWTPVEMVDLKFHVKAPIVVFRQWHRHRTASINEYSARYSILSDDMYMPPPEVMKPQSATNRQGRDGTLSDRNIEACLLQLQSIYAQCAQGYRYLLGITNTPDDSLNNRFDLIRQFAIGNPNWSLRKWSMRK